MSVTCRLNKRSAASAWWLWRLVACSVIVKRFTLHKINCRNPAATINRHNLLEIFESAAAQRRFMRTAAQNIELRIATIVIYLRFCLSYLFDDLLYIAITFNCLYHRQNKSQFMN